jgi:hypothetical protein
VPEWPVPEKATPQPEIEKTHDGYRLQPFREASVHEPARSAPVANPRRPSRPVKSKALPPMADGLLPTLEHPETSWFASVLYPLRGAESLGVIAITSTFFWIFLILVPEYCLTVMSDAEKMGAPTMGHFVSLISILPGVLLLPFAIFYWLQYLGRVLVSSAMGDTAPPRTPDRNFEGFFIGLFPWLSWLVFGWMVGLVPFLLYCFSLQKMADASFLLGSVLILLGLPYILMALMMTFLRDDQAAAKPWAVMGAMLRLGVSFGSLTLFAAAAIALCAGMWLILLFVRAHFFWVYLVLCLGWCVVAVWTSVVVMRVLGTYYQSHKESLLWNRGRPRWGVIWKL